MNKNRTLYNVDVHYKNWRFKKEKLQFLSLRSRAGHNFKTCTTVHDRFVDFEKYQNKMISTRRKQCMACDKAARTGANFQNKCARRNHRCHGQLSQRTKMPKFGLNAKRTTKLRPLVFFFAFLISLFLERGFSVAGHILMTSRVGQEGELSDSVLLR